MHELGPCEGIVDATLRRAAGRTVRRVRIRVGALHRFDPGALDQSFSLVAAGTPAQHAELDVVVVPARSTCRACGHEVQAPEAVPVCPRCGGVDVDVSGGDELVLESLEYASAPTAADGPR